MVYAAFSSEWVSAPGLVLFAVALRRESQTAVLRACRGRPQDGRDPARSGNRVARDGPRWRAVRSRRHAHPAPAAGSAHAAV